MSGNLRFLFPPAQARLFARLSRLAADQMLRRQTLVVMRCRRVGGCECFAPAAPAAVAAAAAERDARAALRNFSVTAEQKLDEWEAAIGVHRTCRRYDNLPLPLP